MCLLPHNYGLSLLLSLFGFPTDRIVEIQKPNGSTQCWIDTLKHPEKSGFTKTTPPNPTVIPDSTIKKQPIAFAANVGKSLIAGSDCKACHQLSTKAIGPSFIEISQRYHDDKTAITKLANKIINGGSGVWGEHRMSAHPQLSKDEAIEMVTYILSVSN